MTSPLRRRSVRGASVVLGALIAASVAGTEPACEAPAQVTEIAAGIYVRQGHPGVVFEAAEVANVGFIIGSRCVAVIDTGGSVAEGEALRCALRAITALPVCFVINTHVHPDHLFGNAAFAAEGVEVVGHARLPRALALLAPTYLRRAGADAATVVAPDRLVAERTILDLGDRRLALRAHPSAHTDNDLSIYDEGTGTLWLSDLLFLEHVPVLDGSVGGWLGVLDELQAIPARRAVPGHGPAQVPWPASASDTRRYLSALRDETRAQLAAGVDLADAMEQVGRGEEGRWALFGDYHKRNVTRAYAELEWEE